VPSSTSSSSDRVPEQGSGRVWPVAMLVFLTALGVWEVNLRRAGFPAEVTRDVWLIARAHAIEGVPVVVGSSRIQAALDLDVWVEELGGPRPAQLAIAGGRALGMLEHLADDQRVTGLVIVDALAFHTFDASGQSDASLPDLLVAYERFVASPAARFETYLRVWFTRLMVWRNPAASPGPVLRELRTGGRLPKPPESYLRADRYRPIDFVSALDTRGWSPEEGFLTGDRMLMAREFGTPATPAQTTGIIESLERAVERIRARGGEVVFITMPACGGRRPIEEARYPRREYWDRLASATSARSINTADYPALSDFPCYDRSHLDRTDAIVFTRNLIDVLFEGRGTPKSSGAD